MSLVSRKNFKELFGLLVSPPVDLNRQVSRIDFMEVNVFLAVKGAVLVMLYFFVEHSGAFESSETIGDLSIPMLRRVFWAFVIVNLTGAGLLLRMQRFPIALVQWVVFLLNALDGIFLAAITVLTGGLSEVAYWLFLGLIVRNSVSVPVAPMQIALNLLMILAYIWAGMVDVTIVDLELQRLDSGPQEEGFTADTVEAFVARIFLMLLLMACCYGVQILFDKQRLSEEERLEMKARQDHLQSSGRLAAEIAHQLKNPLAIINNALFSMEKRLQPDDEAGRKSACLIRDEILRADRIITEVMGFAQLAEGRVEDLMVREVVEESIRRIFPEGADFGIDVELHCSPNLPRLKMQRAHLAQIMDNLLQNARDASGEQGRVHISIQFLAPYRIQIRVADQGAGLEPARLKQIFEAYFTTKDKGTGLGLAIVRNNVEIYGGRVWAESRLGHGAIFYVEIPTRTYLLE